MPRTNQSEPLMLRVLQCMTAADAKLGNDWVKVFIVSRKACAVTGEIEQLTISILLFVLKWRFCATSTLKG